MVAKKEIAPALLAEAKRLYEQTLAPVGDIAAMVGLSRSNFYERVRAGGWRSRRAKPTFSLALALADASRAAAEPLPVSEPPAAGAEERDGPAVPDAAPVTPQQRMAIAQRIMSAVEQEMDAIHRILSTITPRDQLEAEHSARTVASISRALREAFMLISPKEEGGQDDADDDDDDSIPLDIDEFREELARRINSFIDTKQRGQDGTGGVAVDGAGVE
jgi:hypothetical protein